MSKYAENIAQTRILPADLARLESLRKIVPEDVAVQQMLWERKKRIWMACRFGGARQYEVSPRIGISVGRVSMICMAMDRRPWSSPIENYLAAKTPMPFHLQMKPRAAHKAMTTSLTALRRAFDARDWLRIATPGFGAIA